MTFSDLFKVMIIQREITWKWYNIQLYLQWPTIESRIRCIKRRHFQRPWTTPTPSCKVTPLFDAEYPRNSTTYRHSVIEIIIGTYTRPMQQCHFERPWVSLQNIQWHEVSCSLSATAELLVCPYPGHAIFARDANLLFGVVECAKTH